MATREQGHARERGGLPRTRRWSEAIARARGSAACAHTPPRREERKVLARERAAHLAANVVGRGGDDGATYITCNVYHQRIRGRVSLPERLGGTAVGARHTIGVKLPRNVFWGV